MSSKENRIDNRDLGNQAKWVKRGWKIVRWTAGSGGTIYYIVTHRDHFIGIFTGETAAVQMEHALRASGKLTDDEIKDAVNIVKQVQEGNFYTGTNKEAKKVIEWMDNNQDTSQEASPPPQEPPQNASPEEKTPKKGWWEKFKDFLKKKWLLVILCGFGV